MLFCEAGGSGRQAIKSTGTCLLPMILLSTERKKKSKGSERALGRGRERKRRKQMKTENIQVAFDSFTVCCAEWDV